MSSEILLLAVLLMTATFTFGFLWWFSSIRRPGSGYALVGLAMLLREAYPIPRIAVGPVDLGVLQAVAVLLLAAAAYRLIRSPGHKGLPVIAIAFILFAVSLLRGILNGPGQDLDYGTHLLALAGITYGATFDLTNANFRKQLDTALRILALGVIALDVLLRVGVAPGAGVSSSVSASAAFVVALAFVSRLLVVVRFASHRTASHGIEAIAYGVSVVLFQHRTVWLLTLLMLVFIAATAGRRIYIFLLALPLLALSLTMLDALGAQGSREVFEGENLTASLRSATEDDRTLEWRIERWGATIQTNTGRGPLAVAVGAGYGVPWVTDGAHAIFNAPPHNHYIEMYVRYGLVGVFLWGIFTLTLIGRLFRRRRAHAGAGLSDEFLMLVVLGTSIWAVSYSIDGMQPLYLGLALSASAARTGKRPPPTQGADVNIRLHRGRAPH